MSWVPSSKPWVPCTAPLTSGTALRSADLLTRIVEQFQVDTAQRYQPKDGKTYCNIFAWDVTTALGCEVPHWWMGKEQDVNATLSWLEKSGGGHGWERASENVARAYASEGKPALVAWANPKGHGHIAVLLPSATTEPVIAQAGKENFSRGSLSRGFGSRPVVFYVHA